MVKTRESGRQPGGEATKGIGRQASGEAAKGIGRRPADESTKGMSRPRADESTKRIGRPTVNDADRRDTLVRVLTTKAEHEELQQAAASVSMSVSTWMRALALERARAIVLDKAKQGAGSSS